MSINIDKLLDEAVTNIRSDRTKTNELLNDLIAYMAKSPDRHKEVGLTLSKYLETLQRSNEQLVKIATSFKKETNLDLSNNDKDNIFEQLNTAVKERKKNAK